jgi:hypothetical protein
VGKAGLHTQNETGKIWWRTRGGGSTPHMHTQDYQHKHKRIKYPGSKVPQKVRMHSSCERQPHYSNSSPKNGKLKRSWPHSRYHGENPIQKQTKTQNLTRQRKKTGIPSQTSAKTRSWNTTERESKRQSTTANGSCNRHSTHSVAPRRHARNT